MFKYHIYVHYQTYLPEFSDDNQSCFLVYLLDCRFLNFLSSHLNPKDSSQSINGSSFHHGLMTKCQRARQGMLSRQLSDYF